MPQRAKRRFLCSVAGYSAGIATLVLPAGLGFAQDAAVAEPPAAEPALAIQADAFEDLKTVEELMELEAAVEAVVAKAAAATVCIRAGGGSGSGVIVSEDGLVLTAGHVAMRPGQRITFVFPDGSTARGEALGVNEGIDSAIVQITDEGPWPFMEVGTMDEVDRGDWVISMGHPGGFDAERPVVARLGRVIRASPSVMQSDCTIIGGDSGGPLFDLQGRVVGIHSRIGGGLRHNYHVPISTYNETWDRLVAGEMWNRAVPQRGIRNGDPYIGIRPARNRTGATVGTVMEGLPAAEAGMENGDQIVAIEGTPIASFGDVVIETRKYEPGDVVTFSVKRDGEELDLEVTLGEYQAE